jgi:hypothetical protein
VKKRKLDVAWYMPGKKMAFTYTTLSTASLIKSLSEIHDSIKDVYENTHYDLDAKFILKYLINEGYGEKSCKEYLECKL